MNWPWDWTWFILFVLMLLLFMGTASSIESKLKMIQTILEDESKYTRRKNLCSKKHHKRNVTMSHN